MSLRINTNITSLFAQSYLRKSDGALSKSLQRLSTGLRINSSADDASGMAIANVMKAQALGIGQAIRNANDGISIIQIADGALEESVNIVNTIKTKATQAAADGQTLESRNAIQADIDKLLAELDDIAKTTSFNGMKLLTGNFANKKFQVGAFTGQTVGVNIGAAQSDKIGHVVTGKLQLTNSSGGVVELSIYSNLQNKNIDINSVDLQYNNSASNGMGALADAINRVSNDTGVTAQAVVSVTSVSAVAAGSTGSDFAINGVTIGAITVLDNDSDESLVKAINAKTAQHGVTASIGGDGKLTLSSSDGRAIQVTGSTGDVLAGSDMSTFGYINLYQTSANEIQITDKAGGAAIATTTNVTLSNDDYTTSIDSTLAAGSVLNSGNNVLAAGSSLGFTLTDTNLNGDVTTTEDSTIKSGSVLTSGTVIEQGSVLGGTASVSADTTTDTQSLFKTGSVLATGTVLKAGTIVTTDIQTSSGTISAGTVLNQNATLSADVTLQADMIALGGSVIDSGTALTAGSYVGKDFTLDNDVNITQDMTLKSGSIINDDTGLSIVAGSVIGGNTTLSSTADVTTTSDMTLKSGSVLSSGAELATGSTIGANVTTGGDITLNGDMTLAAGSTIASNSYLAAGTVLTNDITVVDGSSTSTLTAGTVLEKRYRVSGDQYLENAMTIKYNSDSSYNSILVSGSILAANNGGVSGTEVSDVQKYSLKDIDVTSQEGAQIAMSIADAALKNLNSVKAELGSIQNQLTSTVANLTVTQVNVTASESQIRDVDFAAESANFAKMQVLMQAGTFALAQANASSQNVLKLLQ